MKEYRSQFRVTKMAEVLKISRSGFYAWLNHQPSQRDLENQELLKEITAIHEKSKRVYGSRKIGKQLNRMRVIPVNHKRVEAQLLFKPVKKQGNNTGKSYGKEQ